MARSPPGGTRPDTPHHHVALWLRATVEMRLRRVYAQGGVWRMCGRGRAGVQQERTAQYGGRMFVFATTQGVQGDMPSAIARGLREKSKSRVGGRTLIDICVCVLFLCILFQKLGVIKTTYRNRSSRIINGTLVPYGTGTVRV